MVASLTGFGRSEYSDERGRVGVEIKSVNNRYLQIDLHLPYGYGWIDGLLRNYISENVSRGKIMINLEVVDFSPTQQLLVNRPLLRQILDLQSELQEETGKKLTVALEGLLSLPGVIKVDTEKPDNDKYWKRILPVLEKSVAEFRKSRDREGANLSSDMHQRKQNLEKLALSIEERVPVFKKVFAERFSSRIKELAAQTNVDEARIATEIAVWADRSDISEELTRLKSHLGELENTLKSSEPIGRRLDFLVQELNREANTISNKIGDLMILQQILEMKCEIEKIREQAQNIE